MDIENKEFKIQEADDSVQQQANSLDLLGMFQRVTVAPTLPPKNFINQIQIYYDGAAYFLYIYIPTVGWNKLWIGDIVGSGKTGVSHNTTTITITSS
jgi:hypothetical protein